MEYSEKVSALRTLIELEQSKLNSFHSAGCPSWAADDAKQAWDRLQTYRDELVKLAGL